MTSSEVSALRAGDWLQESLTAHHRGRPRWGRPREVLQVERIWIARGRVTASVAVAFREARLRWTIVAGKSRHRTCTPPSGADMAGWANAAEAAPEMEV